MVQDPNKTKMVKPDKKVKVKILRDVADPTFKTSKDEPHAPILAAGTVVELPVSEAKILLNRKYRGVYEFSGQREAVEKVGTIRVAEVYKEPVKDFDEFEEA